MYYLIAHMIDKVAVGTTVQKLPLHMTFVHWFEINVSFEQIEVELKNLLQNQKPIRLSVRGEDLFGIHKNILVNRVLRDKELLELHKTIIALLDSLRVTHTNPQWTNDGWNPHVTHKQNQRMREGDEFLFNSVSIISSDNYETGQRKILDMINFG